MGFEFQPKPAMQSPEEVSSRRRFLTSGAGGIVSEVMRGAVAGENEISPQENADGNENRTDRRKFLKDTGSILALAGALGFSASLLKKFGAREVGDHLLEKINELWHSERMEGRTQALVELFEKKYKISIVFGENPHFTKDISDAGSEVSPTQKIEAMETLFAEFGQYPIWLIEKLHIPSITIRNGIRVQNVAHPIGLTFPEDHRMFIDPLGNLSNRQHFKDSKAGAFYKDEEGKEIPWGPSYDVRTRKEIIRRTLHHELFHMMDPLSNSDPLESVVIDKITDEWMNLHTDINTNENPYYKNDDAAQKKSIRKKNWIGFATPYGAKNILEDRATIYETLVSQGALNEIFKEDDMVVSSKRERLLKEMFILSKGMMTRTYIFRMPYRNDEPSGYEQNDEYFRLQEDYILSFSYEEMSAIDDSFLYVTEAQYDEWKEFYRKRRSALK